MIHRTRNSIVRISFDFSSILESMTLSKAIIKQFSLPSRVMHTLRWSPEERQLEIVLMESFVENSSNPVAKTFVEVSNPNLQIYRATLHFDARLYGLR